MISIPTTLTTRQWMKAAKAWRCHFDLPTDSIVAAQLTSLIEQKVNITMRSKDGLVELNPAFIVDVPNKGKKFALVIETVTPQQIETGPYITGMIGDQVTIYITSVDAAPEHRPVFPVGNISEVSIRGLHSALFRNPKFWAFISKKHGDCPVEDANTCKVLFKKHMKVESCKELMQEAFDAMLREFTDYVNNR